MVFKQRASDVAICDVRTIILLLSVVAAGCSSEPIGPAPPGGFSTENAKYSDPDAISDDAIPVAIPNIDVLADGVEPAHLRFDRPFPVGEAFRLTGDFAHPDSRILSATIRVDILARTSTPDQSRIGGKLGSARLKDKRLAYDFETKIPVSHTENVSVKVFVDTIRPGYEGKGLPEPWTVLIAAGDLQIVPGKSSSN